MSASQKANIRQAWLAERIGKEQTDAHLVALCAATFRISEKTARQDLNAVYDRWKSIDDEMAPKHKARFMELGFDILREARDMANNPASGASFAPVVAQFKTLAVLAGVMSEGASKSQTAPVAGSGSTQPGEQTVRDRISLLKSDPMVRAKAMKLGLDLDE